MRPNLPCCRRTPPDNPATARPTQLVARPTWRAAGRPVGGRPTLTASVPPRREDPTAGTYTVQVLMTRAPARQFSMSESSTSSGLKGLIPAIMSSSRWPYSMPMANRQA